MSSRSNSATESSSLGKESVRAFKSEADSGSEASSKQASSLSSQKQTKKTKPAINSQQQSSKPPTRQTTSWPQASKTLPDSPGVYWFVDKNKEILYIGKAKNLKKRVTTYRRSKQLRPRIKTMVSQAEELKYQVLSSELQSLLIEAELIRLHQPEYNIQQKDDKSPVYIHIPQGIYPPVKLVRRQDVYQKNLQGTLLGPYRSSYQLKQVLDIARKIFGWCDKAQSRLTNNFKDKQTAQKYLQNKTQACFYHHLDLCPGACIGKISPKDYRHNLKQLVLFLRGKKKQVLTELKSEMKQAAQQLQFEQAAELKKKVELIEHVTQKKFKLKPELILPAVHDSQVKNSLDHLRKILNDFLDLPRAYRLTRIEGYDVSNIQGKNAAVSLVAFTQGLPDKSNYRLFNIRSLDTPNDYQMLKEALKRRQKHPEWGKPKLIVIDGGKGQLRAALSVWQWAAPVISIAKDPDRLIIPRKHYRDPQSNRLKIEYEVLQLDPAHPALKLVQRIRDESHRFAKRQHSRLRRRSLLQS